MQDFPIHKTKDAQNHEVEGTDLSKVTGPDSKRFVPESNGPSSELDLLNWAAERSEILAGNVRIFCDEYLSTGSLRKLPLLESQILLLATRTKCLVEDSSIERLLPLAQDLDQRKIAAIEDWRQTIVQFHKEVQIKKEQLLNNTSEPVEKGRGGGLSASCLPIFPGTSDRTQNSKPLSRESLREIAKRLNSHKAKSEVALNNLIDMALTASGTDASTIMEACQSKSELHSLRGKANSELRGAIQKLDSLLDSFSGGKSISLRKSKGKTFVDQMGRVVDQFTPGGGESGLGTSIWLLSEASRKLDGSGEFFGGLNSLDKTLERLTGGANEAWLKIYRQLNSNNGKLFLNKKDLMELRSRLTELYGFSKDNLTEAFMNTGRLLAEWRQAAKSQICDLLKIAPETNLPSILRKQKGSSSVAKNSISGKRSRHHMMFPVLLRLMDVKVQTGEPLNIALTGPAGNGKTSMALSAANVLGLESILQPFNPQTSKTDLLGYMDAQGRYVPSSFYDAFVNGKVFVADEFDAANPSIAVILNSAVANRRLTFPNLRTEIAHVDFRALFNMNTNGTGADHQYTGRYRQDAATLDRLVYLHIALDSGLEASMAGIENVPSPEVDIEEGGRFSSNEEILETVRSIRQAFESLKMKYILSPRATLYATAMHKGGFGKRWIMDCCIWRGMPKLDREKISKKCKSGEENA